MALVNQALYDTWAAFDPKARGFTIDLHAQAFGLPGVKSSAELVAVAMVQAAAGVLYSAGASLFANQTLPAELASAIDAAKMVAMTIIPRTRQVQVIRLAAAVERAVLTRALTDGANQQANYADTSGYRPQPSVFQASPYDLAWLIDSYWQPLPQPTGVNPKAVQQPLTPQWGGVKGFALHKGNQFRPVPKDVINPYLGDGHTPNTKFRQSLQEVVDISSHLTAQQKAIAEYWESGPGTTFPPGQWMTFTTDLIKQQHLDLGQSVKLSFTVSQALLDAGIAAWDTKYAYDTVRPITAVRQTYYNQMIADWRGPVQGTHWSPYQNSASLTPNFPSLVSGHSTFSSAASAVLRGLLGTNLFSDSVTLKDSDSRFDPNGFDGQPGLGSDVQLGWKYFSEAADQAGMSRLYGGIHFSADNILGSEMGIQIGNQALARATALFKGSPRLDSRPDIPVTVFGSTSADVLSDRDVLTGQSQKAKPSSIQLYGFGGDDLLINTGTSARVELFGGDGLDSFCISGQGQTTIRDFQVGESIQIARTAIVPPEKISSTTYLQPPQFRTSYQNGNTMLHFNNATAVVMDGIFDSNVVPVLYI